MCSSSHRMPPHLHKASENTSQRSQKSLAVQRVNVLKVFSYFYLKSYPNKSAEFHCFSRCEFIYLFILFWKVKIAQNGILRGISVHKIHLGTMPFCCC